MAKDPGNRLRTARSLAIGSTPTSVRQSLSSRDSTDIWKFEVGTRSSFNVTLRDLGRGADADLFILNQRGRVFASSRKSGRTPETLNGISLEPGTYYVRVQLKRQSDDTRYRLALSAPPELVTPTGLRYVNVSSGTGATPQRGQFVVVNYTGTFQDGTKFDSSFDRNRPFGFRLGVGQVIPGWDEGISTMQVGSRRQLIIPPNLAYGAQGVPGVIPPNATLIFDVELLGIIPG